MLEGSGLCGGVRYRVTSALGPRVHCHCGQCRKASGADFNTCAQVPSEHFSLREGEALLGEFESSPGEFRVFCARCGSPLIKRSDAQPDAVWLRLGTLDSDPQVVPAAHIFVAAKAPWTQVRDGLPQVA